MERGGVEPPRASRSRIYSPVHFLLRVLSKAMFHRALLRLFTSTRVQIREPLPDRIVRDQPAPFRQGTPSQPSQHVVPKRNGSLKLRFIAVLPPSGW